MRDQKTILVAPLNWGLGHASRCIPIINNLLSNDFAVVIASDGQALALLKKEFPNLKSIQLPAYDIKYARKGFWLLPKLILQLPQIIKAKKAEKKKLDQFLSENNIDGIISDGRFGIWHKHIPSVYITHQLKVLSGPFTAIATKLHLNHIKKYTQCWVPDIQNMPTLSGTLGHPKFKPENVRYIGVLSRMTPQDSAKKYAFCCILSGPEPQRTLLENQLKVALNKISRPAVLIQGIVANKQLKTNEGSIDVYNYATSTHLEQLINSSSIIIARSGYSTIMDLAAMGATAFFIPTPGQKEQEYLARHMYKNKLARYIEQHEFHAADLSKIEDDYSFRNFDYGKLILDLGLFEGK